MYRESPTAGKVYDHSTNEREGKGTVCIFIFLFYSERLYMLACWLIFFKKIVGLGNVEMKLQTFGLDNCWFSRHSTSLTLDWYEMIHRVITR